MAGIYKFTVLKHVPFNAGSGTPGVKVSGTIDKDGQILTVFVDAWTSEAAAGMTRKAFKILGLDVEAQGAREMWEKAMSEPYDLLAGRQIDVEEQENEFPVGSGNVQLQYRFMLAEVASQKVVKSMFDALFGAKKMQNSVKPEPTQFTKSTLPGPRPLTNTAAPTAPQTAAPATVKQSII